VMKFSKEPQLWRKKTQIISEHYLLDNGLSHAQCPFVMKKSDGLYCVYFSSRDKSGRSLPYSVSFSFESQYESKVTDLPLLELGKPGTFDDCGVMPAWFLKSEQKVFMYYTGWNTRSTIPYHNSIGLAISKDDGISFEKLSDGPLWDRDYREPYFSGCPCVIKDSNGIWRMWYLSCVGWIEHNGKMEPKYHIKYGESTDGINWKRLGIVAVNFNRDDEMGIVRASVLKQGSIYKMWYCYRYLHDYRTDSQFSYRIGYAESLDGMNFTRHDYCVDLKLSANGWDSEMLCYPHVIEEQGKLLMLYNGNGFGKTGIGYAEMLVNTNE